MTTEEERFALKREQLARYRQEQDDIRLEKFRHAFDRAALWRLYESKIEEAFAGWNVESGFPVYAWMSAADEDRLRAREAIFDFIARLGSWPQDRSAALSGAAKFEELQAGRDASELWFEANRWATIEKDGFTAFVTMDPPNGIEVELSHKIEEQLAGPFGYHVFSEHMEDQGVDSDDVDGVVSLMKLWVDERRMEWRTLHDAARSAEPIQSEEMSAIPQTPSSSERVGFALGRLFKSAWILLLTGGLLYVAALFLRGGQ